MNRLLVGKQRQLRLFKDLVDKKPPKQKTKKYFWLLLLVIIILVLLLLFLGFYIYNTYTVYIYMYHLHYDLQTLSALIKDLQIDVNAIKNLQDLNLQKAAVDTENINNYLNNANNTLTAIVENYNMHDVNELAPIKSAPKSTNILSQLLKIW